MSQGRLRDVETNAVNFEGVANSDHLNNNSSSSYANSLIADAEPGTVSTPQSGTPEPELDQLKVPASSNQNLKIGQTEAPRLGNLETNL